MKTKIESLEQQLLRKEDALVDMGWRREACGYWHDPITGRHEPPTLAYNIAMQRRKSKTKTRKRLK